MLAEKILARSRLTGPSGREEPVDELVLFDAAPARTESQTLKKSAKTVVGSIADPDVVKALVDRADISVFHLASIISATGEREFDLALKVNLDGTRYLLEACRHLGSRPRFVFTSSNAVFGPPAMSTRVDDRTKQTPQTTYGATKAIAELLINDYTRKGFVDGRSARLPTVIVRPGAPNTSASGFASGVIREPLAGQPCCLPVPTDTIVPVVGYRSVVENLVLLHELRGDQIGSDRAVCFPSLDLKVDEMIAGLRRVAAGRNLGPITVVPDPMIQQIVESWPAGIDSAKAKALGLVQDRDIDAIVRAYMDDFLSAG
jgi:nucleoside-diphosphate-sugar epimerase